MYDLAESCSSSFWHMIGVSLLAFDPDMLYGGLLGLVNLPEQRSPNENSQLDLSE